MNHNDRLIIILLPLMCLPFSNDRAQGFINVENLSNRELTVPTDRNHVQVSIHQVSCPVKLTTPLTRHSQDAMCQTRLPSKLWSDR